MLEKTVEDYLRRAVREEGGECIKLLPAGTAGIPDRLVLLPGGKVVFVELKAPGCHPRPLQVVWQERIKALGFPCVVADSRVAVKEVIYNAVHTPRVPDAGDQSDI